MTGEAEVAKARGACLESYRINMTARVWPFLVPATIFISLGALGVCMAFVTHGPLEPYAGEITLAGSAFMLAGLLLTLVVVKPVMSHDEYVAALEGGVLWKLEGEERFAFWDQIAEVTWESEREGGRDGRAAMVIRMCEGEPVVIVRAFGRAPGSEVAARISDLRRKAVFRGSHRA